jgi:hypothetical protein
MKTGRDHLAVWLVVGFPLLLVIALAIIGFLSDLLR